MRGAHKDWTPTLPDCHENSYSPWILSLDAFAVTVAAISAVTTEILIIVASRSRAATRRRPLGDAADATDMDFIGDINEASSAVTRYSRIVAGAALSA